MPKLDRKTQLSLIETELNGALREVAVLKGDDTDETQFFFLSEMLKNHVEKALEYTSVLKQDMQSKMPVSDFVEEGNPDPKQPLAASTNYWRRQSLPKDAA
jgi:hypothetical protein